MVVLIVVRVTTPDHVVDHKWSVPLFSRTMDIYKKNSKFRGKFNDFGCAEVPNQTKNIITVNI